MNSNIERRITIISITIVMIIMLGISTVLATDMEQGKVRNTVITGVKPYASGKLMSIGVDGMGPHFAIAWENGESRVLKRAEAYAHAFASAYCTHRNHISVSGALYGGAGDGGSGSAFSHTYVVKNGKLVN